MPNVWGFTNGLHAQPIAAQFIGEGALGLKQHVGNVGANEGADDMATGITLDASKYNAIYGSSTTVQPPAIVLLPQIKY